MDDAGTIISIAVSVLIIIIWAGYAYNKRRAEAFLAFARRRGLAFSKLGAIDVEKSFGIFRLFSEGFEKKVSNLISGEADCAQVFIFDYSYKYNPKTGEEGQSPREESRTVLILQSERLALPSFHIYTKNIFNKLFSASQKDDNYIHENADFTSSYVLKADDMDYIKKAFPDQAFSYLGTHRGLTIEGKGDQLLFHRYTLLKPDELSSFFDEALEFFRMMK